MSRWYIIVTSYFIRNSVIFKQFHMLDQHRKIKLFFRRVPTFVVFIILRKNDLIEQIGIAGLDTRVKHGIWNLQ